MTHSPPSDSQTRACATARRARDVPPCRARLSVIVPCRDDGPEVAELVAGILAADTLGLATEVILVDDGSRDDTPDVVRALVNRHEAVYGVLRRVAGGRAAAIEEGLAAAEGDVVLVHGTDAALGPECYPDLLGPAFDQPRDDDTPLRIIEL